MGVCIHYMYTLKASLGKSVISGLKDGKKGRTAVVSHIVFFLFINIKSREKNILAWYVLRQKCTSYTHYACVRWNFYHSCEIYSLNTSHAKRYYFNLCKRNTSSIIVCDDVG
jgi:hypothetical protein